MTKQFIAMQVLLIVLLIQSTNQLRLTLNSNEPQTTLNFEVIGKHTLFIVSSGKENHNVSCRVQFKGQILFNKTGNDLTFNHEYPEGNINIIIASTNDEDRLVSFDFYHDDDPIVNIIDKRDLKFLEDVLGGVHNSLQSISRNQQFHIERDQTHKQTLEQSESHIKWTGIVKIVFLLSSAFIQLWIMKGFFKNNNSHSYQPVETN